VSGMLWNGGHRETGDGDESVADGLVDAYEVLSSGGVDSVDDGRVEWLVEGLYDEGGELTPRHVLLVDKPVLVLRADDGSEARFTVTRQLADQLGLVFADCSRAFRGAPTVRGGLLRLREVDDRPLSVRVREFFRVRPLRAYGGVVCGVLLLALFVRILVSAM
jgi:hypothetical protein